MSKLVKHGVGIKENEAERLSRYAKDVQSKLTQERELQKSTPHQRMAEEAKDFIQSYNFFCEECQEDFTAPAYKEAHRFYGDYIVTYRAIHEENENEEPCGEECMRLVTHRDHDPYHNLSDKINRDRNEYALDVLQHDQYGFNTLYGRPFQEHEDKLKEKEERLYLREREKGLKGESLQVKEKLRRMNR